MSTDISSESTVDNRLPGTRSKAIGDSGIWMFLVVDLGCFAAMFVVFMLNRAQDPATFEAGRQSLNAWLGFAQTIILLTSSMFVVFATRAARAKDVSGVKRNLIIGILLGLAFMISKMIGYSIMGAEGLVPEAGQFFGWYLGLTGLHFCHVCFGMGCLLTCLASVMRDGIGEKFLMWIQSAGVYWHVVDLLWVIIFPMLYLLKAVF